MLVELKTEVSNRKKQERNLEFLLYYITVANKLFCLWLYNTKQK